jgi:hypothetical protein
MRPRSLPLLFSLLACGSSGAPAPDGGSAPPDAPGVDGGLAPDGSSDDGSVPRDDEPPITARPARDAYQCRIQRGRTDHGPRSWNVIPPALVKTTGGATFLARFESMVTGPFMPDPGQLLVSSFDLAGTFGAPVTIPTASLQEGGAVGAAPRGDGFAVVWVGGGKLRMSAFDGAGQTVLPPRDVFSGIDPAAAPALATGSDGSLGLVYTQSVGPGSLEARFAVLEPDGTVRTPARPLTQQPGTAFANPAPAIVATSSGYAMIWRDPASTAGGIHFTSTDLRGAPVVAGHQISAPVEPPLVVGGVGGFESPTISLVATPGGFLASWTEGRHGESSGAGSVVRLARLDAAGNRQGAAASLRPFQPDVDEVEPTLAPFGDAVAVLWGHGSHTYVCGGCVPDHSIDLVLVDPATLTPLSNVVSLTNGGDPRAGGLLRRRVAPVGDALLTTYLLTFHVYATPGSAVFGCTKK